MLSTCSYSYSYAYSYSIEMVTSEYVYRYAGYVYGLDSEWIRTPPLSRNPFPSPSYGEGVTATLPQYMLWS